MEKCHRYAISTQSTALQLMFVPRNHAVVICSDICSHVYGSCCCHMFIVHVERSGAVLPFFPQRFLLNHHYRIHVWNMVACFIVFIHGLFHFLVPFNLFFLFISFHSCSFIFMSFHFFSFRGSSFHFFSFSSFFCFFLKKTLPI